MACKECKNEGIADGYLCDKCLIKTKEYKIAVITKIYDGDKLFGGNRYDELIEITYNEIKTRAKESNQTIKHIIKSYDLKSIKGGKDFYKEQKGVVFNIGEILIVDPYFEREIIGHGRKPSKWGVEYEIFNSNELEKAIKCALIATEKSIG